MCLQLFSLLQMFCGTAGTLQVGGDLASVVQILVSTSFSSCFCKLVSWIFQDRSLRYDQNLWQNSKGITPARQYLRCGGMSLWHQSHHVWPSKNFQRQAQKNLRTTLLLWSRKSWMNSLGRRWLNSVATVGVGLLAPSIRGDWGRVHQVSADNLFSPDGGQASGFSHPCFFWKNVAVFAAALNGLPTAARFPGVHRSLEWSKPLFQRGRRAATKLSKRKQGGLVWCKKRRPAVFLFVEPLNPGMSYIVRGQFWSDDTWKAEKNPGSEDQGKNGQKSGIT